MKHEIFNSLSELANFAEVLPHSRGSFQGGVYERARVYRYARQGWEAGVDRINKQVDRIGTIAGQLAVQPEPFMEVNGLEIEMGSYTAGLPECWIDVAPRYVPVTGQVVTVVMNGGVSCAVSEASIERRGIATGAIVAALETSGRSVELWVRNVSSSISYPRTAEHVLSVCVKRAGQPLNLSELAFACMHPGLPRVIAFSIRDASVARGEVPAGNGYDGSYGYPTPVPEDLRGDVYVPELFSGDGGDAELLDWIAAELKRQGIELGS